MFGDGITQGTRVATKTNATTITLSHAAQAQGSDIALSFRHFAWPSNMKGYSTTAGEDGSSIQVGSMVANTAQLKNAADGTLPLATETLNDAGNATNVARAFTRTLGKDYVSTTPSLPTASLSP